MRAARELNALAYASGCAGWRDSTAKNTLSFVVLLMNQFLHNEPRLRRCESPERLVAKEFVMIHVAVSPRKKSYESTE